MTKQQSAVLNTKEAMTIILSEAKKVIAQKANTTIEMVEAAIITKNEKVLSMMELEKLALKKWGVDAQIDRVMEECAELTQALFHFERGRCDLDRVAEEIADVEITMEILKYWIGENQPGILANAKAKKLEHLKNLLGA